jgi:orotidine-5'-phosphate decarboxylase
MIIDRLFKAVAERGPVCVGLDTSPVLLPSPLAEIQPITEGILRFNREIVDATLDISACYKVQIAHYEALGVAGLACYCDTLRYVREKGALVIADVKRGDIASTGEMYAKAHLSGDFEADFLTLNLYMGMDVLTPFEPYLATGEKGVFALVRTSNPSAADFQGSGRVEKPLFMVVGKRVAQYGEGYRGKCGYSLIGGVVGATKREELAAVRRAFPSLFLLVPGYGTQGGGGEDVAPAFVDGNGAVVNASRSVLGAHRGRTDGRKRYTTYARAAVIAMQKDIKQWLR